MRKWLLILAAFGLTALPQSKATEISNALSQFSANVQGTFSCKYFLLNGYMNGKSFVYALDKKGKVAWHHEAWPLPPSEDPRTRTIVVKPIDKNRLALLRPYERSFIEVIDWQGNTLQTIDPQKSSNPYVVHHDFLWEQNSFLTFGNSVGESRKWWKFFSGPTEFLGSPIIRLNPTQNIATNLWDYLKVKDPFQEHDWSFTAKDSGYFWATWGVPKVANNYVHLNSIDHLANEGYLVSARSLNKLLFLDESLTKVLWTSGPAATNTYRTKNLPAEFYRQHHATFLANRNILLFDNKNGNSRIIEVARNDAKHTLDLKREFRPFPKINSPRHGSAFQLPTKNILGYFPNTSPGWAPDFVIEFDYTTGREVARMEITLGATGVGYRAIPIDRLGSHS